MLVTHDYTAVKEDEINVYQGEVVQILASNQQNMFLVFRAATDQCPAAEGWIPGYVLGHTSAVIIDNPDGTIKWVPGCVERGREKKNFPFRQGFEPFKSKVDVIIEK